MSGSDPFDRMLAEDQPGIESPVSRLSDRVKTWLIESGRDPDTILRMAMLREQRPDEVREVVRALGNDVDRKVLMALAWNAGSATYDDLHGYQAVSDYHLRERVSALEDAGLVERQRSKYVVVTFTDEATATIVQDALAMWWPSE